MVKIYSKEVIEGFKEYVRLNPEKSYDKIQKELRGTDLGIRRQIGLGLRREVLDVEKKTKAWKYTPTKYKTLKQKKGLKEIQKKKKAEVVEVEKKIPEEKEEWYWSYKIKASLSQTVTQEKVKRGKRIVKKVKKHKKVEFYINSGVKLSKHDIELYVKKIILKEEQSWKLDKIDSIQVDRRRYTDFAGRIKAIMSA